MYVPPSSRRLRREIDDIMLTSNSYVIKRALNIATKRAEDGYYILLITPEEDALELASFIRILAERRLDNVVMITENDNARYKDDSEIRSATGLAFMQAGSLTDRQVEQLADTYQPGKKRLVVANFGSFAEFDQNAHTWPDKLRRAFFSKPLVWPPLSERRADLEGIVDEICGKLHPEGRCGRAIMAIEALKEIRWMSFDDTRDVCSVLIHAFDIMLERAMMIITREILTLAKARAKSDRALRHVSASANAFAQPRP